MHDLAQNSCYPQTPWNQFYVMSYIIKKRRLNKDFQNEAAAYYRGG